ncbi:MAG: hypothetical protein A4S09_14365 [Proteobacteria bacterium SG_bin7]|nr:MAG: hypothetical protein A4S09_14365 [Proteobacteria bacterium SG_bin7]
MNKISLVTKNIFWYSLTTFIGLSVFAESPAELNRRMNRIYNETKIKRATAPSEVQTAFQNLRANNIPLFTRIEDQATQTQHAQDVIVQEFLRKIPNTGMSWLPLAWREQDYTSNYAYYRWDEVAARLEKNHRSRDMKNDDALLLAYLLNNSIYHANSQDIVNQFRRAAENALGHDPNFKDLRHEVHDAPSWTVVERVKEYIKTAPNETAKQYAQSAVDLMTLLLGNGNINEFLKIYSPDASIKSVMDEVLAMSDDLKNKGAASGMDKIPKLIAKIGDLSVKTRQELAGGKSACSNDSNINCRYEYLDLLKQLQMINFSLGNSFIEKAQKSDQAISIDDATLVIGGYAKSIYSIGLINQSGLEKIQENLKFNGTASPEQVAESVREIEGQINNMQQRLNAMFVATLSKYRKYSQATDLFVDDILRLNSALPFANFLGSVYQSIQLVTGEKVRVFGDDVISMFRILNPGIARGKLILPTPEELAKDDYFWDPKGIYVFVKTPAFLQKVNGIMTTDSGSMISHVQLLANNHGIPNVHISKTIVPRLEKYKGQDVLLISLPNGQAEIKLWKDASKQEIEIHDRYNKTQKKLKLKIPKPSRLDINYPVKLEQLRMVDRGIVAGGKAVGQGELARVFSTRVPKAIVLPFGVYFTHASESGIYQKIQNTFGDVSLRGNDQDTVRRRKERLEEIRKDIMGMEVRPEVVRFMLQILNDVEFDHRGVFVRSDTNAEDLPGFVGAGLNDTIPNVKGVGNILKAIKEVWASPFTEKAFTWREDLIENPWDIFPSVIVQLAAPSEKAGIMIVGSPLEDDEDDVVHLAANEGLGLTAVAGDYSSEEVVYHRKSGKIEKLQNAYASHKKVLAPQGGVQDVALAETGQNLLSETEIKQLAELGDKIQKHLKKEYNIDGKWDLEWGIIKGKVYLFQIRPFIGNLVVKDVGSLRALERPKNNHGPVNLSVDEKLLILPKVEK